MHTRFARRTLLAALTSASAVVAMLPGQAIVYDEISTSGRNVDAKGVALNRKFDVSPNAWRAIGEKLHPNASACKTCLPSPV